MEITDSQGKIKQVEIRHFGALEGWDIQMRFLDFAATKDKDFRRAFTMEVLQFARVIVADNSYPLTTDALIDNHLGTWKNIEKVFNEILLVNGIDPEEHVNRPHFWANAGAEMAVSFMAKLVEISGPAVEMMQSKKD